MNKLFAVSAVLFAFALPSLAQGTHVSLRDQKRFDSDYSRWQCSNASNSRERCGGSPSRVTRRKQWSTLLDGTGIEPAASSVGIRL